MQAKKTLFYYGISLIIYLIILLWGLSINSVDTLGYVLISFYFIIPAVSFTSAFMLAMKGGRLNFLYPVFVSILGIITMLMFSRSWSWVLDTAPGLILPSFVGLGLGILKKKLPDNSDERKDYFH